jgi:hypothetical protein
VEQSLFVVMLLAKHGEEVSGPKVIGSPPAATRDPKMPESALDPYRRVEQSISTYHS